MNPHVRWTGRARTPDQAVACPSCGVVINRPCIWSTVPIAHQARRDLAEAIGFVAIEPVEERTV